MPTQLKKIAMLALFVCCYQHINAASQNIADTRISLSLKQNSLFEIFNEISNLTKFNFTYGSFVADNPKQMDVDYDNETLVIILNDIAKIVGFTYKVVGDDIMVTKAIKGTTNEQTTVSGTITDQEGIPLPGATVEVKDSNTGVVTDFNGNYTIEVPNPNAVLRVSYVGFAPLELQVEGRQTLNVQLEPATSGLNEVLVIGYGKQKRRDLTGAVSSVSSEDIEEIPVANPFQALKGKVAGVDVFNSGNEPGANVNVEIRGQRSIGADNSPFIVLDGIPIIGGLNEINPNDIASIEVLKDASATAIYGSRASNGVILITTKRGKSGETVVNYSNFYGLTSVINPLDLMNGQEFAQLRREANRTVRPDGSFPADEDIFDDVALASLSQGRQTDWQDFAYDTGFKNNHQLSVRGGGEKTQFLTSLNYYDEQGIVENSKFEKASLRINLDHEINKKLKFGVSTFITRSKQNVTQNDLYDNVLRLNPLGMPFEDEGNVRFRPTNDESQRVNPLSDIANSVDERFKTRVFASVFAEYSILEGGGLSYRINIGPDLQFAKNGFFYGSNTTNNQGGSSSAGVSNSDIKSLTIENILNYNKDFGGVHDFSATLVQSYQNQITENSFTNVGRLPFDSQTYNNLGSAGEVTGVGSNYQKWRLLSYTARFNYQLKDRYLFTATGRADGSSRFAEGNKWGFFPSAAIAWRISQEPFFNIPKDVVSDLKLRVSYGETGNTGIEPYQTFSTLNTSSYAFGDNGAPGFVPGSISNESLRWETTRQTNIGLDFDVWKQRLSGSINYYLADTEDLLLPRSLPTSSGFTTVLENIGSTSNRGLEVNLSFNDIIPKGEFRWQADFTFSTNRNEITELYGDGQDDLGNNWFIGEPIDVFYDFKKTGIWQTDEAETASQFGFVPGQIKIEDVNGDGALNADDRVVLGSPTPEWIGGMTHRFSYKGFGLSVVFQTRQNNLTFSQFYENNNRLAGRYNNIDVDYWTPENPTNANPRPNVSQEGVFLGSTLAYKNVSYVRVRNAVLSYSFPRALLQNLNIKELSINLTAENPFTFTDYEGFDPEFESTGQRALYPSTKTYALGLNINL